jgi:hypothetical protein
MAAYQASLPGAVRFLPPWRACLPPRRSAHVLPSQDGRATLERGWAPGWV